MPATKEIFAKYLNPVFIETGTYKGDGVQMALDAGFKTIISIELSYLLYEKCQKRFKGVKNVHLVNADSEEILPKLLKTFRQPITFWLDGHYSGGDTVKGRQNTPLLQELDAIAKHPIKTHTIMIDDLRDWTKELTGFNTSDLMKRISTINPAYEFSFEDGFVPRDILVAVINLLK